MPSHHPRRRLATVAVAIALAATGCSEPDEATTPTSRTEAEVEPTDGQPDGDSNEAEGDEDGEGSSDSEPAPRPRELAAGTVAVSPECRERDDADIEHLPDVWIAPVQTPAVEAPGVLVDGSLVGAVDLPSETIPGAVVDGGCIIHHDAPAGCFGAVEITAVEIPGTEIPGVEIPAIGEGATATQSPERAAAVVQPGVTEPQVCEVVPDDGGRVPSVTRPSLTRPSATRPSVTRPSVTRPSESVGDERVPRVYVPRVYLPRVYIPRAYVPRAYQQSRSVPVAPDITAFDVEDSEQTSYVIESDVLFDFDSADLRPAAATSLDRLVAELAAEHPEGTIRVEGHTDAVGSAEYNQQLSEARAESVARYLAGAGIDQARLSVRGHGEAAPVAPNTRPDGSDDPEGRQQNRRVVIGAG